ncbi:MAG TPA: extracellular solute-binding protein, partial [Candidatus Limnocylindrales bacterium]|nr:extracellular solute-binding protein [Candidatus Limnocylindrales bacterium]
DEVQAKVKAAGASAGYELTTYTQGYVDLYQELDLLLPLDESKLSNLDGLYPYFADDANNYWTDADGQRIGVPWTWGSAGITYDSAKIGEMSSWYDLLDPSLKGKIALPDDPQGHFALTTRILGLHPDTCPKDRLDDVSALSAKFVAQSKGVSPSYGDMTTKLVSGEAVACYQGWAAMNSFAAGEGLMTVKTNVPKEGSYSFCDAWAIPRGADNVDTALAWINETLSAKTNAAAAEYLVGGVTIQTSLGYLNKETKALYSYDDLDGLLEQAPFNHNTPTESADYVTFKEWNDRWQELKAGRG